MVFLWLYPKMGQLCELKLFVTYGAVTLVRHLSGKCRCHSDHFSNTSTLPTRLSCCPTRWKTRCITTDPRVTCRDIWGGFQCCCLEDSVTVFCPNAGTYKQTLPYLYRHCHIGTNNAIFIQALPYWYKQCHIGTHTLPEFWNFRLVWF